MAADRTEARAVPPRREAGWLAGIVLVAVAVRVVRWLGLAVMFNDGPVFLALAQAIEAGLPDQALAHPFHPLYSGLVALVHGPVASWEAAAVGVSILCGSLAVVALYGFVRELHGRPPAAIAALLLAVHPGAIEYTGDIQSEGAYLLCFVGAALLLWKALAGQKPMLGLAGGLVAGLAYLARPEGLGIALVAGGLALFEAWREGAPARRALALAVAIGLGAALVVAPYVGFLRVQTGEWTFTQKKSMAVMAGLEAPPRDGPDPVLPRVSRAGRPADGRIKPRPRPRQAQEDVPTRWKELSTGERYAEAVFDVARTHLRSLRYEGAALLVAGLLLGGLGLPGRRGRFVAGVVLAYAAVLLLLAANVGYVSGRHALPPLVLTFGYLAAGALALAERAGRARRVALVVLLLAVAGVGLGKALRPDRTDSRAQRDAAEWLAAHEGPVRGVAARKRRIAYYAGSPHVKIHPEERSAGKLWTKGASHLILSDDPDHYPALRASLPGEAVRLHRIATPAPGASVYELPTPPRFRKQLYRDRNLLDRRD